MSYSLDQLGANWPNLIIGWVAFIKAPHLSCSQLLELQHLLWCHSKAFIYKLQPIATFFLLMRPLSGFEFETHALSSDSNLLANIRLILILEYRRTSLYAEVPIHENTVITKSNKDLKTRVLFLVYTDKCEKVYSKQRPYFDEEFLVKNLNRSQSFFMIF